MDGSIRIRGEGLDWSHLATQVDAQMDQLVYRNFNYGSSTLKGKTHLGEFELDLENKGKDFPLKITGNGFIKNDSSAYDFDLTTGALELYKAGWVNDSMARGAAAASLDVQGKNGLNWTGNIDVSDLLYENQNRAYYFKDINLTSGRSGDERTIALLSDLGTAHLSGIFTPAEIPGILRQAINRVVRVVDEPKTFESKSLKAEVSLNNTDIIFDLLKINLALEPGTVAEFVSYTDVAFSHFEFVTPGLQTGQSRLGPTQVLVSTSNGKPFVNVESDFFRVIGGMETDSILLAVKPLGDSIDMDFSTIVKDSTPIHLKADVRVFAGADESVDIFLRSLRFNLGKYDFASEGKGHIIWDRKRRIEAHDVVIRQRGYGNLALDGTVSSNPADTLFAEVTQYQIGFVDHLFKDNRFRLSGLMDAKMGISNVYERAVLSGFARVDNFALNADTLGVLDANLALDRSLNRVVVEADIVRGTRTFLDAKGYVGTKAPYNLEFNLQLDRLRLNLFEPILAGALNRLRGTVDGNLTFFGTTTAPQMRGELRVHRAGFGIPYLGVDYALEGTPAVHIEPGRIFLPSSRFRETSDGSAGVVEASVFHRNLSNWELDIRAQGKDLLALKKPGGPEEFLYGKAYANGNIRIYGPVDLLNIRADATSAAGSEVFINADNPTEVGESGFVEFVTPGSVLLDTTKGRNIPSGLDFELNLTLVPNSKGHLILDQEAGDAISGSGSGKLKINLKRDGSLTMAGTITVEEGEYLFTLRNLTRKVLKVDRGGTISWTGDPYQATLNINALYSVKTSLSPPLDPAQFAGKRGVAQVDVRLTEELTNPSIAFAIRLPNEPPNVQSALNNKLYDQDKINQQAFSLLIFNSFTADQGSEQNYLDRGLSNTYNMVASQLANYINAGNDAFDLTLNYNTSANTNPTGNADSEVEVGVSKQFFDDRITVNGSVGVPVGGNTTNQLVGDVEVEFKLSKDGRWKGKAFNRNNQYGNTSALAQQNAYTQGVGVQYNTDFDTWNEFWDKLFRKKRKEEDEKAE